MQIIMSGSMPIFFIVEYQIAQEAHKLRIMGEGISVEQRINGYLSLMDHIAEIRRKFLITGHVV
jgi:hypothetical protein